VIDLSVRIRILVLVLSPMVLLIVILEVYDHQGNVIFASVVHGLLGECISDLSEVHALSSQLNDFASHVFF